MFAGFFSRIYHIMSISTFGRFPGSFELLAAAPLTLKPWFPKAAVPGDLLASLFFDSRPELHDHDPRRPGSIGRWFSCLIG
jgi:hypothetical protein